MSCFICVPDSDADPYELLYGYVSRIQIQDPNPGSESGSKEKMYNFNFLPSHVSAH